MSESDSLHTRIEFAVYRDEPVPGWPANYRRVMRAGFIALIDLKAQELDPLDVAIVIIGTVDPARDAIVLDAEPTIVPIPETD